MAGIEDAAAALLKNRHDHEEAMQVRGGGPDWTARGEDKAKGIVIESIDLTDRRVHPLTRERAREQGKQDAIAVMTHPSINPFITGTFVRSDAWPAIRSKLGPIGAGNPEELWSWICREHPEFVASLPGSWRRLFMTDVEWHDWLGEFLKTCREISERADDIERDASPTPGGSP